MRLTSSLSAFAVMAAGLSACGSSTVTTFVDNTPAFTRDIQAYNTASAAVRAAPNTSAVAMAGVTGTYRGEALVQVLGSGTTRNFLGDATLIANLGAGTVSGSLSGFTDGTDQTDPQTATGSISVTGQSIGGSTPSRFVSGVSGTLTSADNTVTLGTSGTIAGNFRNDPADSLFASGAINGSILNGVPGRAVLINVYADK